MFHCKLCVVCPSLFFQTPPPLSMESVTAVRHRIAENYEIPAAPEGAVDDTLHPLPRKRPRPMATDATEIAVKASRTVGLGARKRRMSVKQTLDASTTVAFPHVYVDPAIQQFGFRNEQRLRASMERDMLLHMFFANDPRDIDALVQLVVQLRAQWVLQLGWQAITPGHHRVIEYALHMRCVMVLRTLVLAALYVDLGFREALVRATPRPTVHPMRYAQFMNPANKDRCFFEITRRFRDGERGINHIVYYVSRCAAVYATCIDPAEIYTPDAQHDGAV